MVLERLALASLLACLKRVSERLVWDLHPQGVGQ
jgi:hypothetical protein